MSPEPEAPIRVLVADDDADQRVLIERILSESEGVEHVTTSVPDGTAALRALREQVFDVALLDLSMPGLDGIEVFEAIAGDPARPQVVFVSGFGTVATATQAMKLGAFDFVEKPVDIERLRALVWKAAEARRVLARSERLGAVTSREQRDFRLVTRDPAMERMLAMVERVAASDATVLVAGESGTGKELVARELHRLSARNGEPMVALNCAAVTETLAESELFGHEKGAFTSATARKIGLIEMADGGTLFLDEIGDLASPLQAKLLRVLEEKRFRRVGGVKELPANFRLVSATNRPLEGLVESGRFRQDLFYRINAIVLELPPLRERRTDIPLLTRHFLSLVRPADSEQWEVSPEAEALLEQYAWPGNVRELRNVIERAALLARGRTIRPADLSSSLSARSTGAAVPAGEPTLPSLNLARLERLAVEEALERAGWHQGRAAELLGISDRTLHRKIRAFGLKRPD